MAWLALLIVLVGLRWQWPWAVGVALLACAGLLATAPQPLTAWLFAPVGLLVAFPLVPWQAQRLRQRLVHTVATQHQALQTAAEQLQQRVATLTQEQTSLVTEITRLSELYRVTKDTAGDVRLAAFCQTLTNVLSTTLSFQRWWLLVTARSPSAPRLSCREAWVGSVEAREVRGEQVADEPRWQQPLLEVIQREATPQHVPAGKPLPWGEVRATSFAWIPLVFHEQVVGIMVCEQLPASEFGRAQVIAQQVTLQLHRIALYDELERLAVSDGLTGLWVRRYFLERLHEELRRAARHQFAVAVVLADLDHFKTLNDTYGHLVGDEVLKHVAELLKVNVREIDLVGRYGGEEFVVGLAESGREQASLVTERIRQLVADQTVRAYDETVHVTVSMGIALFPLHGSTASELLECADQALYQAKASGRNRIVIYRTNCPQGVTKGGAG